MEEFVNKVVAIASFWYDLEEEVVLSYMDDIERCYERGFTAVRTVQVIAARIF